MQSERAAVVQVSQCEACPLPEKQPEELTALHVCGACHWPRREPGTGSRDHFSLFGLPVKFGIDADALRSAYFEVSRALHPDRFVGSEPDCVKSSLDRMSLVNEAYRTLQSHDQRREYIVGLMSGRLGFSCAQKGQDLEVMELAQEWFEVQDSENFEEMKSFHKRLQSLISASQDEIARLESEFDELASVAGKDSEKKEILIKLSALMTRGQTYRSLLRDVLKGLERSV